MTLLHISVVYGLLFYFFYYFFYCYMLGVMLAISHLLVWLFDEKMMKFSINVLRMHTTVAAGTNDGTV